MQKALNILMAQINPTVGAIEKNTDQILKIIQDHQESYDLIVFPELTLTGYPPEDLLFREELHERVAQALVRLEQATLKTHAVIGHPTRSGSHCFNSASILTAGQCIKRYHKQILPNYGVFDEQRYFTPGPQETCLFEINGHLLGLCICEDLWGPGPVTELIRSGAQALVCINASPFDDQKYELRKELLHHYATQGVTIIYVNQVGGQDELVFDGQSLVMNADGHIAVRAPAFEETLEPAVIQRKTIEGHLTPLLSKETLLYQALQCGLRDYVNKNHFPGVLLGLSGGIDSALTLAIAADALGSDRVHAVLMPSRHTAEMSVEDALQQAKDLNVSYSTLPIEPAFAALQQTLAPSFTGLPEDLTEENLQARIRGILLMALSNKSGKLVLTTSNKSETAVGYATLYGDMAGGFSVLKDVLKTQVYALAQYRNGISNVIPKRVLTRPPSAELAPHQTDQDTLPEYSILDAILTLYMEHHASAAEIIAQGYEASTVYKILKLIARNEYKRRQSAPGVKISRCAFGRDWRYPLTSGFIEGVKGF